MIPEAMDTPTPPGPAPDPALPSSTLSHEDRRLAETLLRAGLVRPEQLRDVLDTCATLVARGCPAHLSDVLLEKRIVDPERLRRHLDRPEGRFVQCAQCRQTYAVAALRAGRDAICPACSGPLVPTADVPTMPPETTPAPPAAADALDPRDRQGRPFGRYRLLEELGHGGMGVVWKAWDTQLKRIVALKQILAEGDSQAAQIERFERESRLAAQLRHPNIVGVLDVGVHEGQHYFTTEYIAGSPLDAVMKTPVPARSALEWVAAIAEALAYAHERGIVHRDIKPGNILVDAERRPFVMDFGLAKEVEGTSDSGTRERTLTASGALLGTPQYMSPEQASGRTQEIGPAADQFSLAAVLYELLTGRPPFDGASLRDLLNAITDRDPPHPAVVNPRLHRDVATICLRGLEKRPAARYPTMAEFARDIRRYLDAEPIRARPVPGYERLARRLVKNRKVAVPLALAALLVVGLAGYVLHLVRAADTIEAERRSAVAARQQAETAVRKAGVVQAVLGRWVRLAAPIAALQRLHHDSTLSPKQVRERAAAAWGEVEEFLRRTQPDPTSQATARALAGWARCLAGSPEEGLTWIRESRRLDPDLPYGALMEGLLALDRYVTDQPVPVRVDRSTATEFLAPVRETESMRALRGAMDACLRDAAKAGVWGEGLAQDFRRALAALRDLGAGRYPEAEAGLSAVVGTLAMQMSELEILLARGKVRYILGRHDDALLDLERVAAERPEQGATWAYLGHVRLAAAAAAAGRGEDPRPILRKAVADLEEAARLEPGRADSYVNRAHGYLRLGEAEDQGGGDPRLLHAKALHDLDETLRLGLDDPMVYNNRGITHQLLGEACAERGEDPLPHYRRALADLDRAVAQGPEALPFRVNRAEAWLTLAQYEAAHGTDARPSFAHAIADLDEAHRRGDQEAGLFGNRGYAWLGRAEEERERGVDPHPSLERAVADFTETLRCGLTDMRVWSGRGHAWMVRGESEVVQHLDAAGSFEKAIADLDEALRRAPAAKLTDERRRAAEGRALSDRGFSQLGRGEAELAHGQDPRPSLGRAVADFTAARERGLDAMRVWAGRGRAWLRCAQAEESRSLDPAGSYRKALADLEEALRRAPGDPCLLCSRGEARLNLAAHHARHGAAGGDAFGPALADLTAAVEKDPNLVEARRGLARAWYARGETEAAGGQDARASFDRALQELDEVLRREPGSAQALHDRGQAGWARGRAGARKGEDPRSAWERALSDFAAALRIDPDRRDSRLERAGLLEEIGRPAEAAADYEVLLKTTAERHGEAQLLLWRARARAAVAEAGGEEGGAECWVARVCSAAQAVWRGDYAGARALYEEGLAAAGADAERLEGARPLLAKAHCDLARIHALASAGRAAPRAAAQPVAAAEAARERDRAFDHLRKALELGYANRDALATDENLAPLSQDQRWRGTLGTQSKPAGGR